MSVLALARGVLTFVTASGAFVGVDGNLL